MGGHAGIESACGGVYFYRHLTRTTVRWLVDPRGEVVEHVIFHRD